jgi:glutamate-ammonia-ligase adenylyltransferase
VAFVHAQGDSKIAIQLGHAGRKGSTRLAWEQTDEPLAEGNWPLLSASAVPYLPDGQVHQAMTRARFCMGLPSLEARFEEVRRSVICAPRDLALLAQEIVAMRNKLRTARPVPAGRFDVKHSPGGMVDAEFVVQYLVLGHAAQHPGLLDNVGNIALLHHAEAVGLLPPGVGQAAADGYRELRRAQHLARLDELPTQVDPLAQAGPRAAILSLWQAVLGDAQAD